MFIEELQAHRAKAGLTQETLAEKTCVSASLLRKIETGQRRPQRDFALWCDEFFGLPGTFERFHRLTLLETFPEWFADRMIYEELAAIITEWCQHRLKIGSDPYFVTATDPLRDVVSGSS